MADQKLIEALNKARARELGAIIQYMMHHYTATGMSSPELVDQFKDTAVEEMKHAEWLGERIDYLGGEPTTKPTTIHTGGDLKKMLQDNLAIENEAVEMYRDIIKLAASLGDSTTRLMMEEILAEEEDHVNAWQTALGLPKG